MKLHIKKFINSIFRREKKIDYGSGVYPPDDFTGVWEVYWPNGKLKWKSGYKNGKAEGEHLCLWANGTVAQKGQNSEGECIGEWFDYWESGSLFKRTDYVNSTNFKVFWYDPEGNVTKLQEFVNGILK